jgi:S1-C subfamily serine protease
MLQADNPPPRNVGVVVSSGEANEMRTSGMVLGVDRTNDLAILRVQGDAARFPPPLPVDSATNLVETQKVYVFGFPLGVQLGKNITVSESAVSALRRNAAGKLQQVQVNGGMHPGNSGGPVTDARGVVVGVSVSGLIGTQINFAIPGDLVKQALDGGFAQIEVGVPYRTNNQTLLPLRLTCLDPLGRVRDVKVDVWPGMPGRPLSPVGQAPQPQAGDGAHQAFAAAGQNGLYAVDVPLPPLEPGKVYWIQPTLVNAAGVAVWDGCNRILLGCSSGQCPVGFPLG